MRGIIFQRIDRPPSSLIVAFQDISVAMANEASGGRNLLDQGIRPLAQKQKIVGPAITCVTTKGDNLMAHKALALAQPGDVLFISGGGYQETALWGSIMSRCAIEKKIAGVVVDGPVRDVSAILDMNFLVWSRGIFAGKPTKECLGSVNVPIECSGVHIYPGDLIIADDDGVVIISKEVAAEVLQKSRERKLYEEEIANRLRNGETTLNIFELNELIENENVLELNCSYQSWLKRS